MSFAGSEASARDMNNASRALATLFLIFVPALLSAAPQAPETSHGLPFSFQEYRLRNGLRVVLSEDDRLPLVTVAVGYGAGTLYERPGQEGLAYLLENLMFQGSENVGPLQHITYVQKVGGELNATTTADEALFHETLPSNQLALALWLESDRMKSLIITSAAIRRTREDLLREHEERLAADPYLGTFAEFDEILYPDPLYGHALIGPGMAKLTEAEIVEFYRIYYVPNNAVLCIVGHIDPGKTRELVARYFDSIPPGLDVPFPRQAEFRRESDAVERTARVSAPGAGFHMGFRFFPLMPGEASCLRLLECVLLDGETSRLRNRLLHRELTATYLTGTLEERPGLPVLKVFCLATNAVLVARSEKAILSEIDKLKSNPLSAEELQKVQRRYRANYLNRISTGLGKARFLVEAVFTGKGLDSLGRELDAVLAVTPQVLAAFTAKYFVPQNRAVLEIEPR